MSSIVHVKGARFATPNSVATGAISVTLEDMEGFVHTFKKRPVSVPEDRNAYWLSKTPEERIEAVGMINLTIKGEKYAQQEFPRVCQIVRGKRG